ncbi:UDP-N-acetylmuramoyl-L-alanyl-D-glutamate--2,6-diaminopimelate ligase [bacterium]|nr:UDP-N-acetylmuramoyl-L-alanyl-D-glutamate--2,6-diaminopimelate ligase [bacterium]
MKLFEAIRNIPGAKIIGDPEVDFTSMEYDSRKVQKGSLYCALKGKVVDGNRFIEQAIVNGAVAILTSNKDCSAEVAVVVVEDDREGMALLALEFYGDPTKTLFLIGISGTNGKTSISVIIEHLLIQAGIAVGRIGTLGWSYNGESAPLSRTTPEAPDLLKLMKKMVDGGATHLLMEVTSIALPMKRIFGFDFNVGIFTNFSQDHLDIHLTMHNYFQAKKLFYDNLNAGAFVLTNVDDPEGKRIVADTKARVIQYSIHGRSEYGAEILESNAQYTQLKIRYHTASITCKSPLIGEFNVSNLLAAVATAVEIGIEPEQIAEAIPTIPQIPGRLEAIYIKDGVTVFVDYSHSPDAIEKAASVLRSVASARLLIIFGAGGDRDKSKRPLMAEAASRYADKIYITSDNPRTEDPSTIIDDIIPGVSNTDYVKIVDRREAIIRAINDAKPNDIILLAGKGHEDYQEVNGVKYHFDDREEVRATGRVIS